MKVEKLANVKAIYAAQFYSFALTGDEKVYSWGLGLNYVLATRKDDSLFEPKEVRRHLILGDSSFQRGENSKIGFRWPTCYGSNYHGSSVRKPCDRSRLAESEQPWQTPGPNPKPKTQGAKGAKGEWLI